MKIPVIKVFIYLNDNTIKINIKFINKYKNNNNVKLKLHIKTIADIKAMQEINNIIIQENITNVELTIGCLNSKEYLEFMKSLDCYVLVSKGEGFSFTPREALALGIPCILSNNSAHKELCETPYVIPVKSEIREIAKYIPTLSNYGEVFNCEVNDVEQALEYVYNNYDYCLEKAHQGRIWVAQYKYKNLENKYLNLIKPEKIILGNDNIITDNYIMTNSKELYRKYLTINS